MKFLIENKKGNYKPLFWAVGIFLILASLMSLILGQFVDISATNPNSFLYQNPIYDFFQNTIQGGFVTCTDTDISFFGFALCIPFINIFALFGSGVTNFMALQLVTLTWIPNIIIIPMIILGAMGLIWSAVKLILP